MASACCGNSATRRKDISTDGPVGTTVLDVANGACSTMSERSTLSAHPTAQAVVRAAAASSDSSGGAVVSESAAAFAARARSRNGRANAVPTADQI